MSMTCTPNARSHAHRLLKLECLVPTVVAKSVVVRRSRSRALTFASHDSPSHQLTRLGQTSLRSSTVLLTSCTQTQSPTVGSEIQFCGLSSQDGRSVTSRSTLVTCVCTRQDSPCVSRLARRQVWTRRDERGLFLSSWTGRDGCGPGPLFLETLVGLTLG